LGVVIYVPYQFDLVPTTLSSYVSGPIAVRDADD